MKMSFTKKIISFLLVLVLGLTTPAAVVAHAAEDSKGKYVKEVFIAYGSSEGEAKEWLTDNGWEPVGKDLNAGNTSDAPGFKNAAAVMGIKRTNDPNDAVTDMATMNMRGGYSFDDYESLVKEKKADITEFIRTFIPVLEEYRANYNGEGSEAGKKRAQYAHDLLNMFYDGNDDEYAVNDTGMSLGDLFLNKTKTEIGDDAYNALSADEKKNTGDFEQIILESTGPAVATVEKALALASDTADTTWLERLPDYAGDGLFDHLTELVPEAKGKRITESIAMNYLNAAFGDAAEDLAEQWYDVNAEIIWFENFCDDNELWQEDGESDEDYSARIEAFFNKTSEDDDALLDNDFTRYTSDVTFYSAISEVEYEGDWGDTLYDFFRDEDEEEYGADSEYFLPFAAALSKGQRAGLSFLPLRTLLQCGLDNDDVMKAQFPKLDEFFKDEFKDAISIYSGMNRAIFRRGVALTTEALMKKNEGSDPYMDIWDEGGLVDIVFYSVLSLGVVSLVSGTVMAVKAAKLIPDLTREISFLKNDIAIGKRSVEVSAEVAPEWVAGDLQRMAEDFVEFGEKSDKLNTLTKMSTAGRWMAGIGGALILIAAILKTAQLLNMYNVDFSQIPKMIVNKDDIVTYSVDKKGNVVKDINFNQYVYYDAVKCNRQQKGLHKNAQKGVDKYAEWGCGDVADLGCDIGKQWLALYVNKSSAKGDPILADSITVQYGNNTAPSGYKALHMFTFTNAVDIGSDVYNYRNDKKGIYMFWDTDENAYTASAINNGYLAIAAIGGLAVGIVGTSLVTVPKRKKNEADATA